MRPLLMVWVLACCALGCEKSVDWVPARLRESIAAVCKCGATEARLVLEGYQYLPAIKCAPCCEVKR